MEGAAMSTAQLLDASSWEHVRTRWVGAICTVDEVVLRATGQSAILKYMHTEHLSDPGVAARCVNEGLILRHLHQDGALAGIPRLLDMGILPTGSPGLLLELLGDSLAERMGAPAWPACGTTESIALLLQIGAGAASTLAGVHRLGVVHRDLRPDNILLKIHGSPLSVGCAVLPYLIDFGLAKTFRQEVFLPISTGDEDILGTDLYMAPEQWECAKRVTGAADVYSLGIVLYLLASGHPPFSDARRQVLMYEHLVASPPPLPTYVPRAVSQLIRAMLAKRSADRPSAQECAERLSAKY